MMNRILITGASGFVGQNLTKYFKDIKGVHVNVLNLRNLTEPIQLSQVDTVIHLAGKAHDLKKTSNSDEYYEVNCELTKKLYDAFLLSDAKKFIFLSSVKAAADSVEGILTEDYDPFPKTDYGKSKLLAEQYIKNQTISLEKSYYILRPCMIHGKGNKGNLNLLYKFVKSNIPYPLGAFKNKRSFLSVQNLCFIIHMLIEKDVVSGIYNVADDEALSTNEVVSILSKSLSKRSKIWHIPIGLIRGMAKAGDLLKLPLNKERLDKLTENYVVSNDKIKSALGVELPLTTRAGLISTAESFHN